MFFLSILKDSNEAHWVTHIYRSEAIRGQFGNRKEIGGNERQDRKSGVTWVWLFYFEYTYDNVLMNYSTKIINKI